MKKWFCFIVTAALVIVLAVCTAACKHDEPQGGGDEIDLTSQKPVSNAELNGDWYGIFTIVDAGGKYEPNRGVTNDCVMRVACPETGEGTFYLVVNAIGELFDSDRSAKAEPRTAAIEGNTLTISGSIAGVHVDWKFTEDGGRMICSEVFGSDDFMRVEMVMRHCGDEWSGDRIPESYEYTCEHGFGGVVNLMGGETSMLPTLSGEGLNLHLSDKPQEEVPQDEFDAEGRTISDSGRFSIVLPEGYTAVPLREYDLAIENDTKQASIYYNSFSSEEDPLNEMTIAAGNGFFGEVNHNVICEFDCYTTVVREAGGGSRIILFGKNGKTMISVVCLTQDDVLTTLRTLNNENSDFGVAVLNMLVKKPQNTGKQ